MQRSKPSRFLASVLVRSGNSRCEDCAIQAEETFTGLFLKEKINCLFYSTVGECVVALCKYASPPRPRIPVHVRATQTTHTVNIAATTAKPVATEVVLPPLLPLAVSTAA